MLTTFELVSGLLGYWASTWLFAPECWSFYKKHIRDKEPVDLNPELFGFFAFWLTGDFAQLIALLVVGKYQPQQVILYIIVAAVESVLLGLMLIFKKRNGPLPKPAPKIELPAISSALAISLAELSATRMPPGNTDLERLREKKRRDTELRTWAEGAKSQRGWMIQGSGLITVLFIFGTIWGLTELRLKETHRPLEVSERPDSTVTWAAWYTAWFGFACWVIPRLINIGRACWYRRPESITVESVILGAITHGFNIGAVVLVNHEDDPLYAQLPFVATSAVCVCLDAFRLFLTYIFSKAVVLPPWKNFLGIIYWHGSDLPLDPRYKPLQEKKEKKKKEKRSRSRRNFILHPDDSSSGNEHESLVDPHNPGLREKHRLELRQAALMPPGPDLEYMDTAANSDWLQERRMRKEANRRFLQEDAPFVDRIVNRNGTMVASHADLENRRPSRRRVEEDWVRKHPDGPYNPHDPQHPDLRRHMDQDLAQHGELQNAIDSAETMAERRRLEKKNAAFQGRKAEHEITELRRRRLESTGVDGSLDSESGLSESEEERHRQLAGSQRARSVDRR
ncbi:hypothetical protein JCM11641_007431 [Rhodosporidiobolus odoratus]